MKRGLLYVVFGKQYDNLAVHTIIHSRLFTDLPIHIITNVSDRNEKWNGIKNISFSVFNTPQNRNRDYKTRMDLYSPFDETLYLDCDAVIRRNGIEHVFDLLQGKDLVLNMYLRWVLGDKILRIYKKAMKKSKVILPLCVYNGAIICFGRGLKDFFILWNRIWKETGKGREMPALACAIKKSRITVQNLPSNFFASDIYAPDCVVQHNYNSHGGMNFFNEFGLPQIKEYKPFDNNPADWNWVEFDER